MRAETAIFAAIFALTGCAGARTSVTADDARYPISMSRAVRDSEGEIAAQDRLTVVGSFQGNETAWGTLYSAIRLTPKTDISEKVNAQVAAVSGDAIVNLRVKTSHCAADFFVLFSFLPLWPGCSKVEVEGDIVKVKP